ncbi:PepSY-associated TM helix domain-containing protein [Hyphomicrobium sp.]|uniref:PepSY-associated TM helix domain-containing protein n=1 Tax=Hyphomicrobium sp. TaxID=82 RepID=UPI002D788F3A|nr:PepSY-associated TM helix domain-containing protein [Hyphomicrobium sp.]HET6388557.1 PepSY-associated TM helix domain-containing protein [Hyphomicrobium sp.]
MAASDKLTPAQRIARSNRRAEWMRQIKQWHWISGAISLTGMLLFALTGLTLNHAALISSKAAVTRNEGTVPPSILEYLKADPADKKAPLPAEVSVWAKANMGIALAGRSAEWSSDEVYVSLPRPGRDGWLSIDRTTGAASSELTDRGWISYFNDLHKGRTAGAMWSLFIDVFAVACIVFSITGLILLQLFAKSRPSTWPLVGFGIAVPLAIAIFLIH